MGKPPRMPVWQEKLHQIAEFIRGMRWIARVTAGYLMTMGFDIIFSDDARFAAPGYQYFRAVPGSPDIWGLFAVVAGFIMAVGISMRHDRVSAVGALLGGLWSGALSTSFLLSAVDSPQGNLTAIVVYGKDAIAYIIFAIILFHYGKYRKDKLDAPFSDHQTRSDEAAGSE